MIEDIYSKKRLVSNWFNLLQQTICYEFEKIDNSVLKYIYCKGYEDFFSQYVLLFPLLIRLIRVEL